ncbi:MAG: hypothetical protein ABI723_09825 [Bacteroidia bacterium]
MKKIANIISHLFHPLLMPLYCMALIFFNHNYLSIAVRPGLQRLIYAIVFITTFLMPSLSAIFLFFRGQVQSLQMPTREERVLPFIITSIYFFICYYLIRQLSVPYMLSAIVRGAVITLVLAMIINFKWKISIHMVGIGGAIGMLFVLSQLIFADYTITIMLVIFLAGILGSVRIYSGGHTPAQVYAGFLMGAFVEYVTVRM